MLFRVIGVPRPQGSKNARVLPGGRRAVVYDVNPHELKAWRRSITAAAASLARVDAECPFTGPVEVRLVFALHRPQKVPEARDGWPMTTPDLDKLTRAVWDSLTYARVFLDDSQVCRSSELKVYSGDPDYPSLPKPGVLIEVRRLSPRDGVLFDGLGQTG